MRPGADVPYRPCVGIALFNRDGLVFVGKRKKDAGPEHVDDVYAWQMPQGGIDKGEDPLEAAKRELWEETNVRSATLLGRAGDWYTYDLPSAVSETAWKGRWRGQTQLWFAFRFEGSDDEINVAAPAGGKHKPEFDAWRWERLETTPGLIIPFKRPVYEKVAADFARFAAS